MARTTLSKEVDELLKPAFKALKRNAMDAIRQTQEEMRKVLKVRYDTSDDVCLPSLPAPRLQLRWEQLSDWSAVCHYEMVFPLAQHDVRNDPGSNHGVVELGRTNVNGERRNWETCDLANAVPYRDGVHMDIDAAVFGGMPAYVIAPDGRSALVTPNENATARGKELIRSASS
ncbi:hypothetical protein [Methylobacterium sp. 1973]|uniref:hypothetical protein n=1 Tax=Methylobacterium sp. 1973 TaxID=3156421 RepID=UPI0033970083